MALNWTKKSGRNNVPSYQVSAIPFVTRSATNEVKGHQTANEPIQVKFPFVTRWFVVRCTNANRAIRVGFSRNGLYGNLSTTGTGSFFTLPKRHSSQDDLIRFELGVTDLFFVSDNQTLASDFCVIAGLTDIPRDQYYNLTSSNGFEGIG